MLSLHGDLAVMLDRGRPAVCLLLVLGEKPRPFFLERYVEAYQRELDHFISMLHTGTAPLVGVPDGVKSLRLAEAALQSLRLGRAVAL
jgi:myo-inositol 2-dehydrogenase/D-chiro-inositol 1-dehydrogenase